MFARAVDRYTALLQRARYAVVVAWFILGIVASFFVMPFIRKTTQHFAPPPGSPAAVADDNFNAAFPALANRAVFTVFADAAPAVLRGGGYRSIVDVPSVRAFYAALQAAMLTHSKVLAVENYYDIAGTTVGRHMVAPGNNSVIFAVRFDAAFNSKAATDFVEPFTATVDRLAGRVLYNATLNAAAFDTSRIEYGVSGIAVVVASALKNVEKDMGRTDAVVMPCALVVFMLTVRSGRLVVFPLIGVGLTLAVSFGVCCFIADGMGIFTSVPSLMMSLCISMSIDYNLFLLSRYFEEIAAGNRGPAVVAAILKSAGRTILVSGTTLMVPFAALCALPMQLMQSFGVGCSLVIVMAMLISLTFTPALLLAGACFFERCTQPWSRCCLCCCCAHPQDQEVTPIYSDYDFATPLHPPVYPTSLTINATADNDDDEEEHLCSATCSVMCRWGRRSSAGSSCSTVEAKTLDDGFEEDGKERHAAVLLSDGAKYVTQPSIFHRLAVVTRFPFNLITVLVVLAVGAGFGWKAFTLRNTDSFTAYITRGTETEAAYHRMVADFGFGFMEPYTLLFQAPPGPQHHASLSLNGTVLSEAAWTHATAVIEALAADPETPSITTASFIGPVCYGGRLVPWSTVRACVTELRCPDVDLPLLLERFVSKDRRSMVVQLTSDINPTGNKGHWLYKRLLATINAVPSLASAGTTVGLAGVGPAEMAAVESVYDKLPVVVAASAASVFVILGVSFRSVMIPLRALLTIAITEAFVLGLAVLVFQDEPGILDWMGWGSLQSQGAVSWIGPVVGCLVTLGVALDYDVFLVARVAESLSEQEEAGTTAAVVEGLCSTGRIITAAGLIMAIAFFGLVLTPVTLLNIVGFILVAAVLFDTFVVRTVLVPAVMSLLGRWNWWPGRWHNTE